LEVPIPCEGIDDFRIVVSYVVWGGRISGIDFSPYGPFKNTASDFQLNLTHPSDTINMFEGFK
jgi:hypothetical protein